MAVLSAGPHTDAFTEGVQGVQPGGTGGLGTGLSQEPPCVPGPRERSCGWQRGRRPCRCLWPAALLPEAEALEGGGQGPSSYIVRIHLDRRQEGRHGAGGCQTVRGRRELHAEGAKFEDERLLALEQVGWWHLGSVSFCPPPGPLCDGSASWAAPPPLPFPRPSGPCPGPWEAPSLRSGQPDTSYAGGDPGTRGL